MKNPLNFFRNKQFDILGPALITAFIFGMLLGTVTLGQEFELKQNQPQITQEEKGLPPQFYYYAGVADTCYFFSSTLNLRPAPGTNNLEESCIKFGIEVEQIQWFELSPTVKQGQKNG